jgi:SAM-dependent methyltransferase
VKVYPKNEIADYLDTLFATSGAKISSSIAMWRSGVAYEVNFWNNWFKTQGLGWQDEYKTRLSLQPLAPWLAKFLPGSEAHLKVLDVGCGPITKTGTFLPGKSLTVIAVDPLARFYEGILNSHNVVPPSRTQFSFAEDLSARFEPNEFDLVSCTNALDHSIDPLWGILEMINVLKIGGHIFLGHHRNEAENENYSGFHQWNFDGEEGEFWVWNKVNRVNVTRILSQFAQVDCVIERKRHGDPTYQISRRSIAS